MTKTEVVSLTTSITNHTHLPKTNAAATFTSRRCYPNDSTLTAKTEPWRPVCLRIITVKRTYQFKR